MKKKKKQLFNRKNKYLIAARSCFVSVVIIHDEVDIKEQHAAKFGKTDLIRTSKR